MQQCSHLLMSKQEQTQKIEQEKNLKKGIHIYTLTHSHKSKAKFVTALVGHAYLSSQGTCALSRHYVPVRCNLLEPGQGARRSTDCTSHCRCGHPVVPPVPLAVREVQPVHFAPQYKTRYRFYRWVGWRYYSYELLARAPGDCIAPGHSACLVHRCPGLTGMHDLPRQLQTLLCFCASE